MTAPRRTTAGSRSRRQATQPQIPDPRTAEKDLSEMSEPDDLPFPDDWRPQARPEYVVVIDRLRGWQPGQQPSLAELLETGRARTREPEPDLEAEP